MTPKPTCAVIHAAVAQPAGRVGYSNGITNASTDAHRIGMAIFEMPPGAVDDPVHTHDHETAAYVLSGRIGIYYGERLEIYEEAGPGDFLYVPEDVPHLVLNASPTETARVVVARTDPQVVGTANPVPALEQARIDGLLPSRRVAATGVG